MGRPKKTDSQLAAVDKARDAKIYTADTLLQKGRFTLSLIEQRLILYTISHVKPTDEKFQEYTLRIKDFYEICGMKDESYTDVKRIIQGLQRKSWWILMEDPNEPGTECESLVNWFTVARTNKRTGKFTIMFHPDMVPYLLELARQWQEGKGFYTQFTFRYILPMKSQYSVRLYQLLKPYQKNNAEYYFLLDDLKRLLDCKNYTGFKDFRVRVLEPAVKEINKFSDIKLEWEVTDKDGKKATEITFYMTEKNNTERVDAQKAGLTELDGKIHYWDSTVMRGQMNLFGYDDEENGESRHGND